MFDRGGVFDDSDNDGDDDDDGNDSGDNRGDVSPRRRAERAEAAANQRKQGRKMIARSQTRGVQLRPCAWLHGGWVEWMDEWSWGVGASEWMGVSECELGRMSVTRTMRTRKDKCDPSTGVLPIGAVVHIRIPDVDLGPLDPKQLQCVVVGNTPGPNRHKFYW